MIICLSHNLESDLTRQKRLLVSMQETITSQEFNLEAAEKLSEETTTLKKQQESVEKINENLKLKVQHGQQFLKNDMTRVRPFMFLLKIHIFIDIHFIEKLTHFMS